MSKGEFQKWGRIGGRKRMENLTPAQRSALGRLAAQAKKRKRAKL